MKIITDYFKNWSLYFKKAGAHFQYLTNKEKLNTAYLTALAAFSTAYHAFTPIFQGLVNRFRKLGINTLTPEQNKVHEIAREAISNNKHVNSVSISTESSQQNKEPINGQSHLSSPIENFSEAKKIEKEQPNANEEPNSISTEKESVKQDKEPIIGQPHLSSPIENFSDAKKIEKKQPEAFEKSLEQSGSTPILFINLPKDIQHHIFSFLQIQQIVKAREVSKTTKNSVDEYSRDLKSHLKLLLFLGNVFREIYDMCPDLKKNPTLFKGTYGSKLKKYNASLDAILGCKELDIVLQKSEKVRVALLTHLTSSGCPYINWNEKGDNIHKALINLYFKYASPLQFLFFFKNMIQKGSINVFIGYELQYPALVKVFFEALVKDQQNRLTDISIYSHEIENLIAGSLAIILSPELTPFLKTNEKYREMLLTSLVNIDLVLIDWNNKATLALTTLIDLFFNYASDEQLTAFIKYHVCIIIKVEYERDKLRNPALAHLFLDTLTKERKERLAKLLGIENLLLTAMAYSDYKKINEKKSVSRIDVELISLLYQKNPLASCWNEIRTAVSNESILIRLLPHVWTLDIANLFNQFKDYGSLAKEMQNLLGTFKFPLNAYHTAERLIFYLLPYLRKLSPEQLKVFTFAFTKTFSEKAYDTIFVQAILRSEEKALYGPVFEEFIPLNANSDFGGDTIMSLLLLIKTKEQAVAFIQACQQLSEPFQSLHFRVIAGGESPFENMKEAFQECGLEDAQYQPVNEEIFRIAFLRRDLFQCLKNIQTVEELQRVVNDFAGKKHLLKALAGGIQVLENTILKTQLAEEIIQQVFKDSGLDFAFFNKRIMIDDFLQMEEEKAKTKRFLIFSN